MKPEPKPQNVVCSVCGLPWEPHGEDPTLEACVRLLVAELAKRPQVRGLFDQIRPAPMFPSLPNTQQGVGTYGDPIPQPTKIWC